MEAYDKIKKSLAVAFMHDLDNNRPEGKMCLSNGECADIEKAFNDQDWPKLARYLDKYTESEDERIRKSLINFLSSFELMRDDATFRKGDFDLDAIKGYISYLEKQKEPKLAWSEDEKIRTILSNIFANFGTRYILESEQEQVLEWLKKQKEQKPDIEFLQRSWYMEGYRDGNFGNEPKWIVKTGKGGPRYEENPKYGQLLKKQKPVEWSEEDKWKVSALLAMLKTMRQLNMNGVLVGTHSKRDREMKFDEIENFLKSLRPQSRWKPSEEDKKILHAIELHVGQLDGGETINGFSSSDMLRVLKSIYEHL